MRAKPQIPLAIVCIALALAYCTSGLAQSKPSAGKPAAVTSQPPSTSAAPASVTPASATPPTTAPANVSTSPPKGTATVEFRDGLLHIIATDADLNSVLQQVSHVTGMRLQGGTHGDRLYGDYGPAIPADVLDHMLGGLPYNFIMTQAPRTTAPQQLVISSRHGGATTGTNGASNGSQTAPPLSAEAEPNQPEAEEQPEPGEPADTNVDVNFAPPSAPAEAQPDNANGPPDAKTPEQFLEELKKLHQSGNPQ